MDGISTNDPLSRDALADAVSHLTPRDDRERKHQAEILALLRETTAPFDRQQFAPGHITGSALIVSRDTGKVLLIYHRKLDRWLQPGGHVEAVDGDDPAATAEREAREETGLTGLARMGLFDLDVHAIPARVAEPEHRHFDLRYRFAIDGTPTSRDAELATRWFSPDEIRDLKPDAGMRRMLAKIRAS